MNPTTSVPSATANPGRSRRRRLRTTLLVAAASVVAVLTLGACNPPQVIAQGCTERGWGSSISAHPPLSVAGTQGPALQQVTWVPMLWRWDGSKMVHVATGPTYIAYANNGGLQPYGLGGEPWRRGASGPVATFHPFANLASGYYAVTSSVAGGPAIWTANCYDRSTSFIAI